MPVNKDALRRYRIIDRMLADPNRDYTTEEIAKAVNKECESVSIRMIQKDLLAIKEDFNKELVRNAGGRGTVKYADQSTPLFYQELTLDDIARYAGFTPTYFSCIFKEETGMELGNNKETLLLYSKRKISGLKILP